MKRFVALSHYEYLQITIHHSELNGYQIKVNETRTVAECLSESADPHNTYERYEDSSDSVFFFQIQNLPDLVASVKPIVMGR